MELSLFLYVFRCCCLYFFIYLFSFWNDRRFISKVKVLLVEIFKLCQLTLLCKTFILANRVDPSEPLHSAAAHNGLPSFLLRYALNLVLLNQNLSFFKNSVDPDQVASEGAI